MSDEEIRGGKGGRSFRVPRWLIITGGIVLLLIVAGYATLKLVFTPEKLRAMVVPRVEEAVGRDVAIGSVGLRVFPRLAVRLEEFRIANPPGFGDEPAMSLEALELQVAFWPLLRREIELNEVRLIQPVIRYEVLADGRSNLEGLGGSDTTQAVAEGGSGSAAAGLVVSDLVVRDGTILYTDHETGRGARLALGASLSATRPEGARRALMSEGEVELYSIQALLPDMGQDSIALPDSRIEYEMFADMIGDSARVRRLEISLGETALSGGGAVYGLGSEEKRLDFQLQSGDMDVSELLASLPPGVGPADLDASGRARLMLRASGPLGDEARPEVNGTLDLQNLAASYAEYGRLLQDGAGELTFTTERISIPSFRGQLLGREWQLQLTISDLETRDVEGSVQGGLRLSQLAELRGAGPPMEGEVSVDLQFAGSLQDLQGLRATGPVHLSDLSYRHESLAVPARVESAELRLTGSGIAAERIPIELGQSDLTLSFNGPQLFAWALKDSAARAASQPQVQFTASSNRFNVAEVMSEDTTAIGYGSLVSARLAGRQLNGRDPAAVAAERYAVPPVPPVNATGTVRIAEFLNPPTRARNVSFDVELTNGRLELRDLAADVYGGRFTGGASVDMSGGRPPFGLRYELELAGAQAGTFLERWTRLGRVVQGLIDFRIAGTGTIDESLLPVTDAVEATGFTTVKEGSFVDFPITRALVDRLGTGGELLKGFRSLGGGYEIKDGRFVLEAWELASSDATASVSGAAGLGGTLDLTLQLAVPPSLLREAGLIQGGGGGPLGNLIGQLSSDNRPIQLGIGVGGTMSDPSLQIDTKALQQALEKRLEGTGKDLLKRLIPPN